MSVAIDIVGKSSLMGQSPEAKTIVEAATESESGTVESTIPSETAMRSSTLALRAGPEDPVRTIEFPGNDS
jgi:hypothetical protein